MVKLDTEEAHRQATIAEYQLAQRGREALFDDITRLAADVFGVPIALVTVLAQDEQLFQGACGIAVDRTARGVAFCNHTIRQPDIFVVEDAAGDGQFKDNPLVTGPPFIRFYAGAPIRIGSGIAVGSLCLIDQKPRKLSEADRRRLVLLASVVRELMELRVASFLAAERGIALERQAELLRATFDNVEEGVALFDTKLGLILWNDLFFTLFGLDAEARREGLSAHDLLIAVARRGELGTGDPEEVASHLLEALVSSSAQSVELQREDGVMLQVSRAPLPDGRSIFTVEDVTAVREVARMKDQFVSTVSHELRTPLTSIVGSLGLLNHIAGSALEPRAKQLLTIAKENAQRLSVLIDDILDAEKLGNSAVELRVERIDLAETVHRAVEQNRPYAATLDVELRIGRIDSPLIVQGDPDRLVQAMTNLISNAAKFSSPGASVDVSASAQEGWARVEVSDRGPGIPADFRSRLFQRFSQAGRSKERGRSGTGLGLAITKAIVERHGGQIDFETEMGKGTRFWFDIPLEDKA